MISYRQSDLLHSFKPTYYLGFVYVKEAKLLRVYTFSEISSPVKNTEEHGIQVSNKLIDLIISLGFELQQGDKRYERKIKGDPSVYMNNVFRPAFMAEFPDAEIIDWENIFSFHQFGFKAKI